MLSTMPYLWAWEFNHKDDHQGPYARATFAVSRLDAEPTQEEEYEAENVDGKKHN